MGKPHAGLGQRAEPARHREAARRERLHHGDAGGLGEAVQVGEGGDVAQLLRKVSLRDRAAVIDALGGPAARIQGLVGIGLAGDLIGGEARVDAKDRARQGGADPRQAVEEHVEAAIGRAGIGEDRGPRPRREIPLALRPRGEGRGHGVAQGAAALRRQAETGEIGLPLPVADEREGVPARALGRVVQPAHRRLVGRVLRPQDQPHGGAEPGAQGREQGCVGAVEHDHDRNAREIREGQGPGREHPHAVHMSGPVGRRRHGHVEPVARELHGEMAEGGLRAAEGRGFGVAGV